MHNVKYKENTFTYESLVAVVLAVDYKMLPVLVVMGGGGGSWDIASCDWPYLAYFQMHFNSMHKKTCKHVSSGWKTFNHSLKTHMSPVQVLHKLNQLIYWLLRLNHINGCPENAHAECVGQGISLK